MSILCVLGSPNSISCELYPVAVDRLKTALSLFNPKEDHFLLTGGFGSHFNQSTKPHAALLAENLINHQIDASQILPYVLSSNTVEDASFALPILAQFISEKIIIITSDFHIERVKLIFDQILANFNIVYLPVKHTHLSSNELKIIQQHEQTRFNEILENGLYF